MALERSTSGLGDPRMDTVIIVPVLDDGRVLLIREYAAGTHRYELSLPKGLVEKGRNAARSR